ncbi:MAG: hypothetical protein WBW04_18995 [Nitrolancea sp.]
MNAAHLFPPETRGRATLYGVAAGVATAILIGIPTVLIPNPIFGREVPVRPRDYLFLAITVLLTGLLAATYALPAHCSLQDGKMAVGGFLSFLAVGCPVCNKVVVLALGASGAMSYFSPLQPLLALISTLLIGYAIWIRLRSVQSAPATGVTELQQRNQT